MLLDNLKTLGMIPNTFMLDAERDSRDKHFTFLVENIERHQYMGLADRLEVSPIELQYYALKYVSGMLNIDMRKRESFSDVKDDDIDGLFPYKSSS
jgi:hypothetical protein